MQPLHLVILGLLQGLTEFLPVSSSAHLILLPVVMGWEDQGVSHDIAAHLGTLTAVVVYFRKDLRAICLAIGSTGEYDRVQARLFWHLLVATIPIIFAAVVLRDFVAGVLRSPTVIGYATIGFGLLLWWADVRGRRTVTLSEMNWKAAVVIGCAQCFALVPGTSRAGITMTAALAMGITRTAAARFSFLLSVPTILMSASYLVYRAAGSSLAAPLWSLLLVAVISASVAWLVIHFFLRFLEQTGMLPYVIYRLALGAIIIALL